MKPVANASIITRDVIDLANETNNVYASISIISKRARQVSTKMKEELAGKLSEFATKEDNLEEIFENREQIEISRYYEKLPKASLLSIQEWIEDDIYFRHPEGKLNKNKHALRKAHPAWRKRRDSGIQICPSGQRTH